MKTRTLSAELVVLMAIMLIFTTGIQMANAATQDFHLYGSYTSGWGFSSGSETSPGPTITVNEGDVVNLTLTSDDGIAHQFLLSYHNSSAPQSGDVESPVIGSGQTIVFTFTANVSGTFTYYCVVHPGVMYGTFVVNAAIPEFSSLIVLSFFMVAIAAAALLFRSRSHTFRN